MAFTLTNATTITQSGTDTSWDGMNGLAGVTRLSTGDGYLYYLPTITIVITGTLTITDPSKSTPICSRVQVSGTGNWTSGSFASDGVTPLRSGCHFSSVGATNKLPDSYGAGGSLEVASGGRYTFIGGYYEISAGVFYGNGAIIREYGVDVVTKRLYGVGSSRVRAYTADVIKRLCNHYDVGYDLFRMASEFSVKGFGCEYTAQYVGSSFGGADAKFVVSALDNKDGTYDFDNYGAGWVEVYNCAKGVNTVIVCTQSNIAYHCIPLFQNINIKVTDLSGVVKSGVNWRIVDTPVSNSPTTTITTAGGLKTWDFRTAQTYTGITSGSGTSAVAPVLCVWHGVSNLKNVRFPNSTANVEFRGYQVVAQTPSLVLGSDTAQSLNVAMTVDDYVTLTEAAANALTGIGINVTTKTITLTNAKTIDQLYDYCKAFFIQQANWGWTTFFATDAKNLDCLGWSIVGLEFLTYGTKLTSVKSTGTITANAAIANVNVIGNVTQTTPTALVNVVVSGTLTHNTVANISVTYDVNTAIGGTVSNNGAGLVTIACIGELPAIGSNVFVYKPTTINYTAPSGGMVAIVDNTDVLVGNYTTSGSLILPSSATGIYRWYVAKVGFSKQTGTFVVNSTVGGVVSIAPTLIVDANYTNTNPATVTDSQDVYDAWSNWQASAEGITSMYTPTKSFGAIDFGVADVLQSSTTTNAFSYNTNLVTIKSATLSRDSYYSNGNWATAGTTTLATSVRIRFANLDSEIVTSNVTNLVFYPDLSSMLAGASGLVSPSPEIYRFKHGATVSGITFTGTVYMQPTAGEIFNTSLPVVSGNNQLQLSSTAQLAQVIDFLANSVVPSLDDLQLSIDAVPSDVWASPTRTLNKNLFG